MSSKAIQVFMCIATYSIPDNCNTVTGKTKRCIVAGFVKVASLLFVNSFSMQWNLCEHSIGKSFVDHEKPDSDIGWVDNNGWSTGSAF